MSQSSGHRPTTPTMSLLECCIGIQADMVCRWLNLPERFLLLAQCSSSLNRSITQSLNRSGNDLVFMSRFLLLELFSSATLRHNLSSVASLSFTIRDQTRSIRRSVKQPSKKSINQFEATSEPYLAILLFLPTFHLPSVSDPPSFMFTNLHALSFVDMCRKQKLVAPLLDLFRDASHCFTRLHSLHLSLKDHLLSFDQLLPASKWAALNNLVSLTALRLESRRQLTPAANLEQIFRIPHLKRLDIADCYTDVDSYELVRMLRSCGVVKRMEQLLLPVVFEPNPLFPNDASELCSLFIEGASNDVPLYHFRPVGRISAVALSVLAQMSSLTILDLRNTPPLSFEDCLIFLNSLSENGQLKIHHGCFPSLRHLALPRRMFTHDLLFSSAVWSDDEDVSVFCRLLDLFRSVNVLQLHLPFYQTVDPEIMLRLSSMPGLHHLDLHACASTGLTIDIMSVSKVYQQSFAYLRTLRLFGLYIEEEALHQIVICASQLQDLSLYGCLGVTVNILTMLATSSQNLGRLSVEKCEDFKLCEDEWSNRRWVVNSVQPFPNLLVLQLHDVYVQAQFLIPRVNDETNVLLPIARLLQFAPIQFVSFLRTDINSAQLCAFSSLTTLCSIRLCLPGQCSTLLAARMFHQVDSSNRQRKRDRSGEPCASSVYTRRFEPPSAMHPSKWYNTVFDHPVSMSSNQLNQPTDNRYLPNLTPIDVGDMVSSMLNEFGLVFRDTIVHAGMNGREAFFHDLHDIA